MTTFVRTQAKFINSIKHLVELEYDAIGAYKLAISQLEIITYKNKLTEFLADHERHISELREFFADTEKLRLPTSGALINGNLAKMKVMLGSMSGADLDILKAVLSNEQETNTAYARINNHNQLPDNPQLLRILQSAHLDEVRHKEWITAMLNPSTERDTDLKILAKSSAGVEGHG